MHPLVLKMLLQVQMLHSQFHKKGTIVATVTVTFYHQLSVVVFVKVLK
jgi:hypothetical protein